MTSSLGESWDKFTCDHDWLTTVNGCWWYPKSTAHLLTGHYAALANANSWLSHHGARPQAFPSDGVFLGTEGLHSHCCPDTIISVISPICSYEYVQSLCYPKFGPNNYHIMWWSSNSTASKLWDFFHIGFTAMFARNDGWRIIFSQDGLSKILPGQRPCLMMYICMVLAGVEKAAPASAAELKLGTLLKPTCCCDHPVSWWFRCGFIAIGSSISIELEDWNSKPRGTLQETCYFF